MMKRIVFANNINGAVEKKLSKIEFDGLYFGNEFCEHLLAGVSAVEWALQYCTERRLSFHLVLPYGTNAAIGKMEKLLDSVPPGAEVVFNDWGILSAIRDRELSPVMGRTLIPHSADPRADSFIFTGDDAIKNYFRYSPLKSKVFRDFIIKQGVKRVELDNVVQGIDVKLPKGLPGSIYYPYVYVSTTRKCYTRYAALNKKTIHIATDCTCPCKDLLVEMDIKGFGRSVFLKGNSQFYVNSEILQADSLLKMGIDRIVFFLDFPT